MFGIVSFGIVSFGIVSFGIVAVYHFLNLKDKFNQNCS